MSGTHPQGLDVTDLGAGRYRVSGGTEPHMVELGAGAGQCDCPDHAYRGRVRDCKHVAAVRRHQARAADDGTDREDGGVLPLAGPDHEEPHWRSEEHANVPPGEPPIDDESGDL